MPVTTRQLLRLIHVIEQRFDLTNREKEELLSILDDPSEADEALVSGYFDWLFPRATVKVSSSDRAQKWELQIGPHAQIEAVLDSIHLDHRQQRSPTIDQHSSLRERRSYGPSR